MKRNIRELKNAISDQLVYITNSCFLYDKGCHSEAIRIAGALNILLEKRQKSKGILRMITFDFKLLSTVPDVEKINVDKLVISKCKNLDQIKPEADTDKLYLTYIENLNNWYLQALDHKGNNISCLITELSSRLKELNLLKSNQEILVQGWIRGYSDAKNNINDVGKEIIINHLNALLGHRINYAAGFYFPMIQKKSIFEHNPTLRSCVKITYLS